MRVKLEFTATQYGMTARERRNGWQRIRRMCKRATELTSQYSKPLGHAIYEIDNPEYDICRLDGAPSNLPADVAACDREARHAAAKRFAQDCALETAHTMHFELVPDVDKYAPRLLCSVIGCDRTGTPIVLPDWPKGVQLCKMHAKSATSRAGNVESLRQWIRDRCCY